MITDEIHKTRRIKTMNQRPDTQDKKNKDIESKTRYTMTHRQVAVTGNHYKNL